MTELKSAQRLRPGVWLACGAQLIVLLDFSATNVLAARIVHSVGLNAIGSFWLMTAFALPYAAMLLIGGWLCDRFGAVNTLMVGLLLMCGAGLGCALASDPATFLTARAMQGVAAALVSPAALAMVMRFAEDRQESALSMFGAVSSVGFSAGLAASGVIGQQAGWRVFFVVVAGAAVLLLACLVPMRESVQTAGSSVGDRLVPLLRLSAVVALLVTGCSLLSGGAGSARWSPVLLTAAAVGGWYVHRDRSRGQLREIERIVRRRVFAGLLLRLAAVGATVAPMLLMLSVYQSEAMRADTWSVAMAFMPHGVVCAAFGYALPAVIARIGPRWTAINSLGLLSLGLLSFVWLRPDGSYVITLLPGMLLTGCGVVGSFVALLVLSNEQLPEDAQGMGAALLNVADQLGSAIGLVLVAGLLAAVSSAGSRIEDFPAALAILAGLPLAAAVSLIRDGSRVKENEPLAVAGAPVEPES